MPHNFGGVNRTQMDFSVSKWYIPLATVVLDCYCWLLCYFLIGPFCINGVPLRRVNQAYVIATKTKVDISTLKVPEKLNDSYFRRSNSKAKGGTASIFAESKQVCS